MVEGKREESMQIPATIRPVQAVDAVRHSEFFRKRWGGLDPRTVIVRSGKGLAKKV